MKGINLMGFVAGIFVFLFALFLSYSLPQLMPSLSQTSRDLLTYVILGIGIISPFVGGIGK